MRVQRLILPALALLLLALLGWWVRQRVRSIDPGKQAVTSTPPPSPTATAGATARAAASPSVRHRLAGIAVGDVSFVVIEHPDGVDALYRLGTDVPGLGRVREITEHGATFDTADGPVLLRITAPRTATATLAPPSVTAAPLRAVTTPTRRSARARTARESSP